jgi:hypothetical protein
MDSERNGRRIPICVRIRYKRGREKEKVYHYIESHSYKVGDYGRGGDCD